MTAAYCENEKGAFYIFKNFLEKLFRIALWRNQEAGLQPFTTQQPKGNEKIFILPRVSGP